MRKRLLSLFLVLCMISTMLPSTTFAAGSGVAVSGISNVADSGKTPACENHKQHDENCGYMEAEEEQLCSHLLTDGTYSCAPSVSRNEATPSDADEDYVCPHDDGCGFAEAVEGAPCTHECELCAEPDETEESEAPPDDDEPEQENCICENRCTEDAINMDCPACIADGVDLAAVCEGKPLDGDFPDEKSNVTITAFETLGEPFTETSPGVYVLEVESGTELEELPLPDTLSATGYEISDDTIITDDASPSDATFGSASVAVTIEITWESKPEYDMDAEPGTEFTFSALWDTENDPLGEGAQAPVVTVMLTAPKLMMSLFSTGNLTRGNTYYFDLSDEAGNIGTINSAVPDATLCYVPFTYTGNFQAKKYTSENSSFDFATCDRFVADYNVSTNVSWNDLNSNGLIFGKAFDSSFLLRSLSASKEKDGSSNIPEDGQNEWDRILYYAGVSGWGNGAEWIKNYEISSWAQDAAYYKDKTLRGWRENAKGFFSDTPDATGGNYGWRPAIEITDTANVSVITLDLNGGTFNGAAEVNLVRGGGNFIAPDGRLAAPKKKLFQKWNTAQDGSGDSYLAGDSVPSDVGTLYAQYSETGQEQFNLPVGTYYFDLSGEAGNIGTVNTDLPDATLHYVPFTYAGTVYGYSLKSRSADDNAATTDSETASKSTDGNNPIGFVSDHSLFVADYNVGKNVSWDTLNTGNLIFGTTFDTHYTLRSLSGGSKLSGNIVTPDSNEWDRILQKSSSYIKNYESIQSWTQDTHSSTASFRVLRGGDSNAAKFDFYSSSYTDSTIGWRPALEVQNPDTLGEDGLTAITLNLNGGSLNNSTADLAVICAGESFTAPSAEGLTAPKNGFFKEWNTLQDGGGTAYAAGAPTPGSVTMLYAQWNVMGQPQFNLVDGGTYYFDLSDEAGNIGTVNTDLPDATLHYVPFTYAGTVYGYALKNRSADDNAAKTDSATAAGSTNPDNPLGFVSDHSLFVADYNVGKGVSWDTLNTGNLVFGKTFDTHYTLRSLSGGSKSSGNIVTPDSNEWDQILQKSSSYIKNYGSIESWTQDTYSDIASYRVLRGGSSNAAKFAYSSSSTVSDLRGWRPALEVQNPDILGKAGLTAITLNLNGGSLNNSTADLAVICAEESFTAPSAEGLTAPKNGSFKEWNTLQDGGGTAYAAGAPTPGSVTMLYAQWNVMGQPQFDLADGGTYYFDLSGEAGNIGTVNTDLPDATLHYVPFTYVGTVYGYSLKSRSEDDTTAKTDSETAAGSTNPDNPLGFVSEHSLFVADYNVGKGVSWNTLNTGNLVFGKTFDTHYMLRSLSGGSYSSENIVTPDSNEWDQILQKSSSYIKNYESIKSWTQDTYSNNASNRALRGGNSNAANFDDELSSLDLPTRGWRPALEVQNPDTLGKGGLTAITLNLNGGRLNNSTADLAIICVGEDFTAPGSTGLTRPSGNSGSYFKWNTQADEKGTDYEVSAIIPKSVTTLYARWQEPVQPFIFTDSASYDIPASAVGTAIAQIDVLGGVSGGTMPYAFSASGLPSGITVSENGTISGTPTGISDAGTAEITVTDSTKPTAQTAAITIAFGAIQKGAGPSAPNVTFSFDGVNANKLTGATAAMEYRLDGGTGETGWISCTADTELTASLDSITAEHDIKIRVKETASYFAGEVQTIDITQAATPSLTATQPDIIGGNGSIPMTTAHEYSTDRSIWTAATGATSLAAGTYYVRVKAAGTALASSSQAITLIAFTGTQESTPNAIFTAADEKSGKLTNVATGMKYRVDGGTSWMEITGNSAEITNVTEANGIKVMMPGNGTTTTDSEIQSITITQADTPDLTATQPSMIGGDGSIPMTMAHEYSTDRSTWTAATGTTSLAAGTYYVRVKAAGTALASSSQAITLIAFTGTQESTPNAIFTAADEKSGKLTNVATGMKYSVDGGMDWMEITGNSAEITNVTETNGIKVMMPGNGTTTTDSEVQSITITQAATPDLTATQPSVIGGDGSIPMTTFHEYSTDKSTWTAATGTTALTAGTYYVRVKAAGTALASSSQTITLIAFTGTQESTPNAVFTAADEKSGALTNVTSGMTCQIDNGTPMTISDTSVFLTALSPCTILVVKKGNGLTTTDSKAQTIKVTKASAVSGVSATNCTNLDNNNGTLIGVTTAMEYQNPYESTWTNGTGSTIEGLASGTYQVRIKAADTVLAGASSSFTVSSIDRHSVTYALTNVSKTGTDSVADGQTLNIILQAAASYKLPETITVTMGGTLLEVDKGYIYNSDTGTIEITNITGGVVITAVGVADTPSGTAPTITTTSLPDGIVGTAYSQSLAAIGDTPVTWLLDSSILPDGLALNSSTGVISGIPTTAGTSTFTVKAANSTGNDTKAFTIAIAAADPTVADKTALYAAIQNAENIMVNTVVSVQNGTDVSTSMYWVLPDIMSAAKTALAEANKVTDNPNATQAEVDNAVVKLNAKVNIDFKAAKKLGTKSNNSGESSSEGDNYTPPSAVTPPADRPNTPTTGETDVTAKVDSKGEGTAIISADTVDDSITKAQDTAKKNGGEANGIAVQINVTTGGKTENTIMVNLPRTAQEKLLAAKVSNFIIVVDSPCITVSLNLDAIKSINAQAKADVQISAVEIDTTNLSADAKIAIGSRPAFDLKATYEGDAKSVDSFGAGSVTVAIPYTLQSGETAGGVYAIHVDGNGKASYLTNSSYDTDAKILRFSTNHFSVYGVGYKSPAVFTDIANHWAKTDIEFVVNRGLMNGTGKTTFAPDSPMTRGMFVTSLGRLAGVDVNDYKTSKFTDVDAKAYYALYVNWAAEKGIANGTSDTTFAPDQPINREQMAVMMSSYAKAMGYKVPEPREAVTFADNSTIGTWAVAAVKQMQMAGVINGKDGNRFDPQGTATRAESSAVLHRYVELVIDPATAQGWTRNETGHWYYYKNGKKFIGWQSIDGLWYYFNADGSMAANTKVDGYKIGADGVRKEK